MHRKIGVLLIALGAAGMLWTAGVMAWVFVSAMLRQPSEIAIIGGADAPTAIYIGGRFWWVLLPGMLGIPALIAGNILRRRRK